jgi:uncharacterized membrane protein
MVTVMMVMLVVVTVVVIMMMLMLIVVKMQFSRMTLDGRRRAESRQQRADSRH